ncbi:MAG: hypothetical protein ACRDDZ_11635 [Marinifilaceae bacterium]
MGKGYCLRGILFQYLDSIRLEDDILVTENGCRLLGEKRVPITIKEVDDTMHNS